MISRMKERRKWKSINTEEGKKQYRRLNNQLRRETEKARSKLWKETCDTIQQLQHKGRMDLMYDEVRKATHDKKTKTAKTQLTMNLENH